MNKIKLKILKPEKKALHKSQNFKIKVIIQVQFLSIKAKILVL